MYSGATRWRSSFTRYVSNRKVAGSIHDGVIGIFHSHSPFGRAMTPGVDSVCNRNEYQEDLLGGKDGRCVGLTTLPPSCANFLEILGASTSWNPSDLSRPAMGLLYSYVKYPLFLSEFNNT
jgi:hypothetical protein